VINTAPQCSRSLQVAKKHRNTLKTDLRAAIERADVALTTELLADQDIHSIINMAYIDIGFGITLTPLAFATYYQRDSPVPCDNCSGLQQCLNCIEIDHKASNVAAITELLLEHPSIDVNAKNSYGITILMRAALLGNIKLVKTLLARPEIDINVSDELGHTALHEAILGGRVAIVRMLCRDPRTNPNKKDTFLTQTPLMHATWRDHAEMVAQLLKHPSIDLSITDRWNKTVLDKSRNDRTIGIRLEIADLLEKFVAARATFCASAEPTA
jgi:hypothetical protein